MFFSLARCSRSALILVSVVAGDLAVAQTKKVLMIGIDGARPDALAAAATPNIDALIAAGSYSDLAQTGDVTSSGPGWSSMLTGVWRDKHEVDDNGFGGHDLAGYPHFFTRIKEADPTLYCASFVRWVPIHTFILSGADFAITGGDADVSAQAASLLASGDPDALFLHFDEVDYAGHASGFSATNPAYTDAISFIDSLIGPVIAAMQARPTFATEDWLVLVSTDHGGAGTGHGGNTPEQRTIFFIASGPSAASGFLHTRPNIVDMAVTAATHLGVAIDPAWDWDGRASGLASSVPLGENLIFNGDAEYSSGDASPWSEDRGIPGWYDIGNLTVLEYNTASDFLFTNDPGPAAPGSRYFSGGPGAADDEASLTIDLASLSTEIDLGGLDFDLSAWLGGYSSQNDRASLTASFLDASGSEIASSVLGPVTFSHRQAEIGGSGDDLTGLLERSATGLVPVGTRRVTFTLLAEHSAGGGTDGYADDLAFILTPRTESYCTAAPNSVGPGAVMSANGSLSLLANNFTLQCDSAAFVQPGVFYYGSQSIEVPFGNGLRCAGGSTVRLLPPAFTDFFGSATRAVDLGAPAPSVAAFVADSTWHFQFWYRDPAGGGAGFNLSDGLRVTFRP
jgi:hypothetical protein